MIGKTILRSMLLALALAASSVQLAEAGLDEGLAALQANNFLEALEELLPVADAGNAQAQAEVAMIYHYGLVAAKNFTRADSYYRRAANQENPDGMIGLAVMNALGQGVAVNMTEAYKWLLLARDHLPNGKDRDRVIGALTSFRESMTQGEIQTAEQRAKTWIPEPENSGRSD
ncbi:MAG: tetratricopeptide repeat protein [Rhodospirillaceae bacterium]|nr:tetratricopeptide repeat protein [Rhodospirillaceae bacterium]